MESSSDLVYEGKVIHETSYSQRSNKYKEVEFNGIKIDFYDAKNNIIHEIKKSSKEHKSNLLQLKYYIYKLEQAGINEVTGILEYPKEHKTEKVFLSDSDRKNLEKIEKEILIIVKGKCPERKSHAKYKRCSYYDFCFSGETE